MKLTKRLTAFLLCAACVCALVTAPPASAAGTVSTFPDITDPQVGRAVEALRTMGVIDGGGDGNYDPDGSLTRAAFCKMAILVMGKGDEAQAQANRTIFNDVPGSHWARGYVNLAALTTVGGGEGEDNKDAPRLMMGLGNGSFAPDRVISYGETVTILLRMLGYSKEANLNWPDGAVDTAASLGLTEGFTPPGASAAVTRAQAALLLCNMLTTPISGDKETVYLKSLGYDVKTGALLLAGDTTQNGRSGYVKIFTGDEQADQLQLPAVRNPASFLEGARGAAVYDKNGRFFTFLPDVDATSKTITVASASNGVLTATDGMKYTPSPSTVVWEGGSKESYSTKHTSIRTGASITVCFTEAGAIDYLFVHGTPTSLTGGVMVARDQVSGNPFAQLTAGTVDYKIVKNGVEVTTSALAQYDVAAFDPTNKTLYVTDFRLTGIYESAYPNTSMPTSVKVLGLDLPVLDCAVDDLKDLKLNSPVTFLLSPDGKVAGAVSASTLKSNMVGWVDASSSAKEITINLLNAPTSALSSVSGPFASEYSELSDAEAEGLIPSYLGKSLDVYLKEHIDDYKNDLIEKQVELYKNELRNQGNKIEGLSINAYIGKEIQEWIDNLDQSELIDYSKEEQQKRDELLNEPNIIEGMSINKYLEKYCNDNKERLKNQALANFSEEQYKKDTISDLCGKIREKEREKHSAEIMARLSNYRSSLVTVTGSAKGILSLTRLSGKTVSDALNLKTRTLGNTPLADNIVVFEKVGTSDIKKVSLANIAMESVPASKITYQRTDSSGKIDLLILDDVTGDLYTYGVVAVESVETGTGFDKQPIYNTVTTVKNSKGDKVQTVGGMAYKNEQFIGVVKSVNRFSNTDYYRPAASVALKSVEKVSPNNFNMDTMLFFSGSIELPISDDVQCYNAQTKTWFGANDKDATPMDNLRACLSYSSNLTVYYDRDPGQGGKVRVVVAN